MNYFKIIYVLQVIILFSLFLFLSCTKEGRITESNCDKQKEIPPFNNTLYLDSDIITVDDPTTFLNVTFSGQGLREMFDRRVNDFITLNAFLFIAKYDNGLEIEFQVNPEFENKDEALIQVNKFVKEIGRLPNVLRKDVETVWIHKGVNPFGGGNKNLLIHTGQADIYINDCFLEETFVHEATHTSLDDTHKSNSA